MIEGADSASFDAGEGIQYGGECEADWRRRTWRA